MRNVTKIRSSSLCSTYSSVYLSVKGLHKVFIVFISNILDPEMKENIRHALKFYILRLLCSFAKFVRLNWHHDLYTFSTLLETFIIQVGAKVHTRFPKP